MRNSCFLAKGHYVTGHPQFHFNGNWARTSQQYCAETPSGFSLTDFGFSCKLATAGHSSGELAMPFCMGCKRYFLLQLSFSWVPRTQVSAERDSALCFHCGPWAKPEDLLITEQCHCSALALSAGMLILYNELCIFVLGAKLNLWRYVLQTKSVLPYFGNFWFEGLLLGLAFLLSVPCWSGPCCCTSPRRQWFPGRRDDEGLKVLSVCTCGQCVQSMVFFWHGKDAYQSLCLALHYCG